jgi:hypothetical protein
MKEVMPRTSSPKAEELSQAGLGVGPESLESVPEAWRSIWGDVKEPAETKMRTPDEQAALDRMFGADSSRIFEPEPATRPEYFDIAEEEEAGDDETSEVRFVPRGQPTLPPEESGTAEDRGRRHRRGRRGQSRRRGRRSDSRRSEEIEARESVPTESDAYSAETEFVPNDEFDFEQELSRDEVASTDASAADLLEEESSETGSRRARHRKVASWKDAVGYIIDRNLANRDREPSDGNRRRRGGRRR